MIAVQEEALWISGSDGDRKLIDYSEGQRVLKNYDGRLISRAGDNRRSALEFEIPDWDGYLLHTFIASWWFYNLVPQIMKGHNSTAAQSFLFPNGDNLSSWLMTLQTRHPDSFAKIKNVAKDVFPELEDLFTSPTQQATVCVASRERHLRKPVPAWQMSDGQLAFIALLSLIFSPPDLGTRLYCIEEPENHLHHKLRGTLV